LTYNPNAAWTAKTAEGAQAPIYYVSVGGTTRHFASGPVSNAVVSKPLLLSIPQSVAQKLYQLQGRSSLTLTSLRLADRDDQVTALAATRKATPLLSTLVNAPVVIYAGYAGLQESQYAPIARGEITSARLMEDGVSWEFEIADARRAEAEDLMVNANASSVPIATTLQTGIGVGAGGMQLVDASSVNPDTDLFIGPNALGQEQRVTVAAVEASWVYFSFQEYSLYDFPAGTEVRWASSLVRGNPINLFYSLLTGDFASALFPLDKVRGIPTGLGYSPSALDVAALQEERDRYYPGQVWEFEFKRPTPGDRFLETKINRLLGFPVVTIAGLVSFHPFRPPWVEDCIAGLPTITKADVLSWDFKVALDLHMNRVEIGLDPNAETGKPFSSVISEDLPDQEATGEVADITEADSGLRGIYAGERIATEIGGALIRRYKGPPWQITVRCPLTKRALESGDFVSFSHDEVPNLTTGGRGLSGARLEIVERRELLSDAAVEFLLQDPGFVRPAAWAPDDLPGDFSTATAAQKEYASWAPDSGNMADGSSPYEWI
jgi:hypothetical protein